eukprot:415199_1
MKILKLVDINKFIYLYGTTKDSINIPHIINDTTGISIYYVARYNGYYRGSIIGDDSAKFYFGFHDGKSGVCYFNGYKFGKLSPDQESNIYRDDEWILLSISTVSLIAFSDASWFCTQNCETMFIDKENESGYVGSTLNLTVNGEYNTDWAITEIIIT